MMPWSAFSTHYDATTCGARVVVAPGPVTEATGKRPETVFRAPFSDFPPHGRFRHAPKCSAPPLPAFSGLVSGPDARARAARWPASYIRPGGRASATRTLHTTTGYPCRAGRPGSMPPRSLGDQTRPLLVAAAERSSWEQRHANIAAAQAAAYTRRWRDGFELGRQANG